MTPTHRRARRASHAGLLVCAALLAAPVAAWSQAGGLRLEGGGFGMSSGSASSAGKVLTGEVASSLATGRSSSSSVDLVGGYTGMTFPSLATLAIDTPAGEYVSVTFPLQPTDAAVTSVLDELGSPDRRAWRLGHWSPAESTYVEAAGDALASLGRGRGYFLVTAKAMRVVETGLAAPIADFEIDLEDGPGGRPANNQLGNPFLFPIAVADLLVTDGTRTLPLLHPENVLTESAVQVYDPSLRAYSSDRTSIEGGAAFWVKKLAPGPVRVIVPYRAANPAAPRSAGAKPGAAHWAVAVKLLQGTRASEPMIVGSALVAEGRWNALCVSRAPDPPGGALGLLLHEASWGRWSGDYVRVFRRPEQTMTWDFSLRGAEWPGDIVLAFETFDLPAGARVVLGDPESGWSRDVTSGERVSIAAQSRRRLQLTVAASGSGVPENRLADGLRRIHPNPFPERCGLVFARAGAADVEVRIHDAQGRAVRKLSAPPGEAGERVLVWDGRDDAGRLGAPGVYFARWRVGTASGLVRLVKLTGD